MKLQKAKAKANEAQRGDQDSMMVDNSELKVIPDGELEQREMMNTNRSWKRKKTRT